MSASLLQRTILDIETDILHIIFPKENKLSLFMKYDAFLRCDVLGQIVWEIMILSSTRLLIIRFVISG